MKNILVIISLIVITIFVTKTAFAASPTPTAALEKNSEAIQLDNLKSKIASRVAELNLVEKRGIAGAVEEVSGTQIVLIDIKGDKRYVDVDELTKFYSPDSDSFGISDIAKGTVLGVIGLYNKQSKRIMAREIDVITLPKTIQGAVLSIDDKKHTFELLGEKEKLSIDVATITKTFEYTKKEDLTSSGFSKLSENQNVIAFGYIDIKNSKLLLASRIIIFPEVPRNPKINIIQDALAPETTVIPSTGSGKKLTPITPSK
jgi:predicted RNA-binding protein